MKGAGKDAGWGFNPVNFWIVVGAVILAALLTSCSPCKSFTFPNDVDSRPLCATDNTDPLRLWHKGGPGNSAQHYGGNWQSKLHVWRI